MGEENDALVGLGEENDVIHGEKGDDSIVGDFQDTVAVAANEVLQRNETYSEDVKKRRKAWGVLARELEIDIKKVDINNTRIIIEGVATFYIIDDNVVTTYSALNNVNMLGSHEYDEWSRMENFIKGWTGKQQLRFFKKVMSMNTSKGSSYISTSVIFRNSNYVNGLSFNGKYIDFGTASKLGRFHIRRVYS